MSTSSEIVFLTTYPPRRCGIATFSQDLILALNKITTGRLKIKVAALQDTMPPRLPYPKEVGWVIDQNNVKDYFRLARDVKNANEVAAVCIQHEYGIFGGEYGEYVLEFIKKVGKPVVSVLHTVLPSPNPRLYTLTQEIINRSDKIIVMTSDSEEILRKTYKIFPGNKVVVIPHGIHPIMFQDSLSMKARLGFTGRTVGLTFGLLSRNKGIEYILEALPDVVSVYPDFLYLIVGATHPAVKQREDEIYRKYLENLVKSLNLKKNVLFVNRFLPLKLLLSYIQASDICISCNLGLEQSVSGTLSYAMGSGRAVLATNFRQAMQFVTPEVGRLVPPRTPASIKESLLELLSDKKRLLEMHWNSYMKTRNMLWTNVADEYLKVFSELNPDLSGLYLPPVNLKHFEKMSDRFGLVQFAEYSKPSRKSGYTIDDNARALICSLLLRRAGYLTENELQAKMSLFLRLIEVGRQANGNFINYLAGSDPTITGKNDAEDLEDTQGRVVWAMSEIVSDPHFQKTEIRKKAEALLNSAVSKIENLKHLRAIAFSLWGLSLFEGKRFKQKAEFLAGKLKQAFLAGRDLENGWDWFEAKLTYANGILPAALLKYSRLIGDKKGREIGLKSLDFLCRITFWGDVFVPIGQKGWYEKGKKRALFDQQPEEAYHMMLALLEALKLTEDLKYKRLLSKCFSWFVGNNLLGESLYDSKTAGCYDGLSRHGVNKNQGSESLLSYLMARLIIEENSL